MIGRLRRYARKHGVRALVAEVGRRLVALAYTEHRVTILLKNLGEIMQPAAGSDIQVEQLERRHLEGLSALNRKRAMPKADEHFRENLDRGLHGFVGLRDGEVVAYYWWIEAARASSHPDLDWLGPALEMEPKDVYGSDFYVLAEHRGRGTANAMLCGVETGLRDLGYERLWGYVDEGNTQARWLYSARGYVPIRDVARRRVLFRQTVEPIRVSNG
jgi:GNAT superfamily N-acetyltransferase